LGIGSADNDNHTESIAASQGISTAYQNTSYYESNS
jgi:hypothetical protein